MMVEETVFDEVVTCDHSYDRRCHQSYITTYEAHQEEECEENFRKICYIDYEEQAYDEVVEVCHTPLVKDCNTPGPEVCKTEYETWCMTNQRVHEVDDDVPDCKTEVMKKCKEVTQDKVKEEIQKLTGVGVGVLLGIVKGGSRRCDVGTLGDNISCLGRPPHQGRKDVLECD